MNTHYKNMTTKEKILELIAQNGQQSVKQLSESLDISLSMVHRHIKALLMDDKVVKVGKAPRVFYIVAPQINKTDIDIGEQVEKKSRDIIESNFLYISPKGERIDGWDGFVAWCEKRDFQPVQKADEYIRVHRKYNTHKKAGVISGYEKMHKTFVDNLCLVDIFYADFYAWEVFGKTKLGQLLLYAKQSQNKVMMKDVILSVKPVIEKLIKSKKIDAVGFIPPTVKRQVQFMKVLEEVLTIALPKIEIVKIQTDVVTPQKTLNKLNDRIQNADSTIFAIKKNEYKSVLLIDDAVGSGATLNQVACKLRKSNIAQKVYGFALVGSAKGFDVISEV